MKNKDELKYQDEVTTCRHFAYFPAAVTDAAEGVVAIGSVIDAAESVVVDVGAAVGAANSVEVAPAAEFVGVQFLKTLARAMVFPCVFAAI